MSNKREHIRERMPISRLAERDGEKFLVDYYEAARAKDAELIQRLVDAVASGDGAWLRRRIALAAAEAAGFKPSEG